VVEFKAMGHEAETRAEPEVPRSRAGGVIKTGGAILAVLVVLGAGWGVYSYQESTAAAADAAPTPTAPPPLQVVASKPLVRNLEPRIGLLGQFSAVDQVDIRAQVGGILTEIHFQDGAIVKKGDLLFSIDTTPFDIRLAQAKAELDTATARLSLANQELIRAQKLKLGDAGSVQNVDQRTAEQRAAIASVEGAKAQIRDAQFDLDHCQIYAPFTGRIGNHLVSVGNLVAGSRAATSPTTLLATLVSLDPIYFDFDMSEGDFDTFSRFRTASGGGLGNKVEIAPNGEQKYTKEGVLDFLNNTLDRSSGTMHARATVANPDLSLTPGAFARVRLAASAPVPTLLIPDAAVLPDQSRHLVLTVAADGTVVPKPIETGDLRGGLRVVTSGIGPDDRIIVDGLPYAAPGSKVAVKDGAVTYDANAQN
jgi:multidrug efflux system membrane fusion protein